MVSQGTSTVPILYRHTFAAYIDVLRINQAEAALVSLQPINSRDASERDQRTRYVTGSTCCRSVQPSLVRVL